MKVLFVVSPDYLDAVFAEAKKYDFYLQGYGNLESAYKGLMKTNISDILGFVYLADSLPDNLGPLAEFVKKCDILNESRKFIFALRDTTNLQVLLNQLKVSNIKIGYLPELEVITDSVINKDIIGSILLDSYKPYKLNETEVNDVKRFSVNRLHYEPLFSDSIFDCFGAVEKLATVEQTLNYDAFYNKYKDFNKVLTEIRKCFILREFGEVLDKKKLLELIKDEVEHYCEYRALVDILITGDDYA